MDGGKIKGKGAYGCIFQPPLNCKYPKDNKTNPKYISKLASNVSADQEWKVSSSIKKNLPNYENYAIVWKSKCTPSSKQQDKDLSKCPLISAVRKNPNNFTILQARHGGFTIEVKMRSITNILKSNKKNKIQTFKIRYFQLIRNLESLFQGISEMYENDIVHNDIKDQNIVILTRDASSLDKGTRFIDFGLSAVLPNDMDTLKDKSRRAFDEPRWYFVYPAEYLYCLGDTYALKSELESGGYKQRYFYKELRSIHVNYIGTYKTNKAFDKKIEEIMQKSIDGTYDSNKILYEIFIKNDTYSLAMVFVFLLEYFSNSSSKKIIKNIYKTSKPGSFLGDIKMLLRKMLVLDYKARIDPTKAYKEFQYIMNNTYKSDSSEKKTKRVKKNKSKSKKKKSKSKKKK